MPVVSLHGRLEDGIQIGGLIPSHCELIVKVLDMLVDCAIFEAQGIDLVLQIWHNPPTYPKLLLSAHNARV